MTSYNAVSYAIPHRLHLLVVLTLVTMLNACQKAETVPTTAERLKYVEQKQQTEPDYHVPRKAVDYMSDLKSLKDNVAKAAPVPPPPPAAVAAKAADTKPVVADARPTAAVVVTPIPTPLQALPAAAAPAANVVASAAPTARPVPAKDVASTVTVLSREQPDFPREAVRAGVESGSVRARMVINAAGGVSNVVIVEARPARVFDRSVSQALQRWKFNPGAEGRTYETEVNFKL